MKSKYIHDSVVHNTNAAGQMVPFLLNLFHPTSIIDVGCGTGTWLKIFLENGIVDVKGIEGYHLNPNSLLIPRELVELKDLEEPFTLERKFDMLISLEVAEHLHEKTANQFVNSLTQLSDIIVFSAAVPFQGGQNHVNEQWQTYWIEKFEVKDFICIDIIRPAFWENPKVEFWYKQNSFLFIHKSKEELISKLSNSKSFYNNRIVHPEMFIKKGSYLKDILAGEKGVLPIFKLLIKSIKNMFK